MSIRTTSPGGLLRLACVALAIVMFLSILGAVTVLDLRLLTSKSGISQILGQTLSSRIPAAPRLTLAVGDQNTTKTQENSTSDSLLAGWLYKYLQNAYGGSSSFTLEQVNDFIQKSTLKDFIAEKFSGVVDDFYANQGTVITTEEISQLIDENAELLRQQTGLTFDDALKQEIISGIEDSGMLEELAKKGIHGILLEQLESGSASGSDSGNDDAQAGTSASGPAKLLDLIRKFTSYTAAVIAILVYLACAIGYFFASGRNIPRTLNGCGIPLLIVGLIYAPATVLFLAAPGLLGDSVIATVAALFFRITAPVNLTVFVLGIAMTAASGLLKRKQKKAPETAKATA